LIFFFFFFFWSQVYYLDLAAKLDQTAEYECSRAWGKIEFPAPFGRESLPEEAYIAELDSKTGSSLKLTILNKEGRVWTMVAGGGASVVYRSPFLFLFFPRPPSFPVETQSGLCL